MANGNEGSTPALGDAQARKLLEAPPADTLKGVRDRAILATWLYHGIRREELCGLSVKDLHSRQGVMHIRVLTTSARKTPLRSARFEAETALLPFCPRRFGPLTRFVVAREAFSGTNEFAVTRFCAV